MSASGPNSGALQLVPDASGLRRLAEVASQFGAGRIAQEAQGIAERVTEGLFYVACVGQFKRGKSTLLDALAGERILPTGVIPVTAVPTVIRYGAERRARVRLQSGGWNSIPVGSIEQYVSEEHNPQNQKGVAGVEVFVPAPSWLRGCAWWTRRDWVRSSPPTRRPPANSSRTSTPPSLFSALTRRFRERSWSWWQR